MNSNTNFHLKTIAIDSSTKSTGISVWRGSTLIKHRTIALSAKDKMDVRLPKMVMALYDVLNAELPDEVYIEETVVNRNVATQRFLTRLQGTVFGWCLEHGSKFETIRPTVWRKALGFVQGRNVKREALKQQAKDYVLERYGEQFSDISEDEYEAICIGVAVIKLRDEHSENKNKDTKEK